MFIINTLEVNIHIFDEPLVCVLNLLYIQYTYIVGKYKIYLYEL